MWSATSFRNAIRPGSHPPLPGYWSFLANPCARPRKRLGAPILRTETAFLTATGASRGDLQER
jgi:hypothetical protein